MHSSKVAHPMISLPGCILSSLSQEHLAFYTNMPQMQFGIPFPVLDSLFTHFRWSFGRVGE